VLIICGSPVWCVRLVGQNQADWIEQLREALVAVKAARAEGPAA